MALSTRKICKVAGYGLLGFCAVSIGVDRANIGPAASQVAGFCGAFIGTLVAQRRKRHDAQEAKAELPEALSSASDPALRD